MEGLDPRKEKSPHTPGALVEWAHQRHGGKHQLAPPPSSQPDSERAAALSAQSRILSTVSLQAYWIFNNSICLARKRAQGAYTIVGIGGGQQGLYWYKQAARQDSLGISPKGKLQKMDLGWEEAVGGFKQQAAGLDWKRKCQAAIKRPWHVGRWKPETYFLPNYKSLAQIQVTTVYFMKWWSREDLLCSFDPKQVLYCSGNWGPVITTGVTQLKEQISIWHFFHFTRLSLVDTDLEITLLFPEVMLKQRSV